jgi:hypothetical protein
MSQITTSFNLPIILRELVVIDNKTLGGVIGNGSETTLAMVGLDGRISQNFTLGNGFRCIVGVKDASIWLAFDNRLEQRTLSGEQVSDLEFEFDPGTRRVGAAILVGDEFLMASERLTPDPKHGLSGEIFRIKRNGEIIWGSTLLVDRIAYVGCVEATAKNGFQILPKPAWKPKSWVADSRAPILVSGSQVFVSWQEFPRSGIGKHYAVRLDNGHPTAVSKPMPISWTYNLRDGAELVSANGYSACQTSRFDPAALGSDEIDLTWHTHGRFFQTPNGNLFCVEIFNGSSRNSHVVRLLPDGSTEKVGEPLPGYQTSQPVGLIGEEFCFWRGNQIWVCNPASDSLRSIATSELIEPASANAASLEPGKVAIVANQHANGSRSAKSTLVVIESN